MNTYNVKEIASMLHTDPETVRRWIRTGKLKAEKASSKKEGLIVTEKMLGAFLKDSPKYAGLATTSSAAALVTGGVSLAASVIAGLVIQGQVNKEALENARINPNDLCSLLEDEICSVESSIKEKRRNLKILEKEIAELNSKKVELINIISKVNENRDN